MKKYIAILLLISLVFNNVNAQADSSYNTENIKEFLEDYFENVQRKRYSEAYLMLDDKLRSKTSLEEFSLYHETIGEFFGKLKSHNFSDKNNKNSKKHFFTIYDVEFKNISCRVYWQISKSESKEFKLNKFKYWVDTYNNKLLFNNVLKGILQKLDNHDYQEMFDMQKNNWSHSSFEEFKQNINKLVVDGELKYKLNHHFFYIHDQKIDLDISYEINGLGDISFHYEKKDDEYVLEYINFRHTKAIEAKRNKNLQVFRDTSELFKHKKQLTLKDSVLLDKEFTKLESDALIKKMKAEMAEMNKEVESSSDFGSSVSLAYDWGDLEKKEQNLIITSTEKYILKLVNNDIQGFWDLSHSKFKATTPFISFKEIGSLISEMITSMDSVQFVDGKKVSYIPPPSSPRFSTGGSVDQNNLTYLQFQTVQGIEKQVIVMFHLDKKPLSKIITMKLGFEEGDYKLLSFEINTNSINHNDAEYYLNLSNKWKGKTFKLPSFSALMMAYRLSYLGNGTDNSLSLKIKKELAEQQKDTSLISSLRKWNINDTIFDIINLTLVETKSDVSLNFLYVSKVPLGDTTTTKEVDVLYQYLLDNYPDLVQEFKTIMFTAYEEYPSIRSKQYRLFRVVKEYEKN